MGLIKNLDLQGRTKSLQIQHENQIYKKQLPIEEKLCNDDFKTLISQPIYTYIDYYFSFFFIFSFLWFEPSTKYVSNCSSTIEMYVHI